MNMRYLLKTLFSLVAACCIFSSCTLLSKDDTLGVGVLYNQVGYISKGPKLALVTANVDEFVLVDEAGNQVFNGVPESPKYWEASGDTVRKIYFSEFQKQGEYKIVMNGLDTRSKLIIADNPFNSISTAALKSFYFNRSSIDLKEAYAGKWARKGGHPDTVVYIHDSAADDNRSLGKVISSPFGWYDAGDYNKYVVNSSISIYTLFRALVDFPVYYEQQYLNIPESDSDLPDILSEILFNLRWVLTMQDPADGGVYHKLTTKKFEDFVMPQEAISDRFVVAKSTSNKIFQGCQIVVLLGPKRPGSGQC